MKSNAQLFYNAEAPRRLREDHDIIPKRIIVALCSFALAVLLIVSFAVMTDRPLVGQPKVAPVVAERALIITKTDNAVRVVDADDGTVVMDASNGGFVSVVTDGLERARLVHRIAGNPPVSLTLYENSRLSLHDPATDWRAEISSFGTGNAAVWIELLKQK